jgi:soluble lytic murein transglycosylase-like protein
MRSVFVFLIVTASPMTVASGTCWERAAAESGTTVELLQAIAWVESSMQPQAVNSSHLRTTGTRDIGLVGVNTAPDVLRRLGVSEADLFDSCTNVRAGARILKEKFVRHGMTWEAVGAYNASCTRLKGQACQNARTTYAWRVYHAMHRPNGAATGRQRMERQAVGATDPAIQFVSLR